MSPVNHRALFEHARDGILVLDASLYCVDANRAFAAMLGATIDQVVGRTAASLIHPQDLAAHPLQTDGVARDGSTLTMRRFLHADGSVVMGEVSVSPVDDGTTLVVVRDASSRPSLDALRDSEARFRAVAENLNAGLVVTDLESRAVYVNERVCAFTGYAREELVGRSLAPLLFPPYEHAPHADRLGRQVAGRREQYEVEHRRKDGSSFLGEVSSAPLHDGEGRMVGTVSVVIDVTERYEWEREMAQREHRYRMLFEVTPLPAWVYDTESLRFLAVNPAAVAHYGYTEEQFLGMTILDIRPPDEVQRVISQVRARKGAGGQSRGWGYRHRKADGTLIDVEIISHAFDFDGRQARIVLVNDVTEQSRMRRREREVEAQLVQAQKMEAVGRLAGGVAHDFNNLLSIVLSAAEALEDDLPKATKLREDVSDIRQAVERGAALTRRLLAFGRKEVHAPALVDVNEVVASVQRLLARVLGGAVRLQVRKGVDHAYVLADPSQLEQVLVNLAINARDAMPKGGTLVIATTMRELEREAVALGVLPGPYVSIEVSDEGVGMDETSLARAFEPFFTTKGPNQGTGLGLPTVYGIVKQSAGAVTMASRVGEGTQVTVYLPRAEAPTRTGEAPRARIESNGRPLALAGGRVLLVEDEPRVRAQARRLLERCGYTVIEAAEGAEGERQFRAHSGEVDVVVTDIVMPVLGGVEMVARLRAEAPEVPVVFVSGFTAEDRDLPLDVRTAFVPKPYTIATLCEAIAGVVAA
jgi:PAS domain S-box-containing protein